MILQTLDPSTPPRVAESTSSLPRVSVLLATYNGLAYVSEQVESILKQSASVVRIFVSDDQSTDGTWQWLQQKASADPRIELLPHAPKFGNAARNFYRLLCDADFADFDYVAFSDQDDIWLDNKLSLSIQKSREHNAAVVSSNVIAMWQDGRKKLIRKSHGQRRLDFLFGSAGPGCTYLMTRDCASELRDFLLRHRSEVDQVQFHDWMIYAWARSHGMKWHIEASPTMLYRQHESNEYGANSGLKAFRRRLSQVRSGWYREQILKISRLIANGPTYTAESAATIRLVEKRTLPARVALLMRVTESRREPRDRALLALAYLLGGI
jgi:rhamnosyltransferase